MSLSSHNARPRTRAGNPSITPIDLARATDRGYLVSLALKVLALTDEALESVLPEDAPAEVAVEVEPDADDERD